MTLSSGDSRQAVARFVTEGIQKRREGCMGMLEDLAGQVLGGGGQSPLVEAAMGLIGGSETGGLAGLVKTFAASGLGDAISSWISTGQNQSVSGEEIARALGPEQIAAIARKIGLGEQDAAHGLAGLLPEIIDKLTPDGQVPDNAMLSQGMELLKGKLFGQ